MMLKYKIEELVKLNEEFIKEARRVFNRIRVHFEHLKDTYYNVHLDDEDEIVLIDYTRVDKNEELIEGEFKFPLDLLWADDTEIDAWAEETPIEVGIQDAIDFIEDEIKSADDECNRFRSKFFSQIKGWLIELKETNYTDKPTSVW